MTYAKTDALRAQVIAIIEEMTLSQRFQRPPAYKAVCKRLKESAITTGYGRQFDPTTLYALLYRSGYSGIWGVTYHQIRKRANQ